MVVFVGMFGKGLLPSVLGFGVSHTAAGGKRKEGACMMFEADQFLLAVEAPALLVHSLQLC